MAEGSLDGKGRGGLCKGITRGIATPWAVKVSRAQGEKVKLTSAQGRVSWPPALSAHITAHQRVSE